MEPQSDLVRMEKRTAISSIPKPAGRIHAPPRSVTISAKTCTECRILIHLWLSCRATKPETLPQRTGSHLLARPMKNRLGATFPFTYGPFAGGLGRIYYLAPKFALMNSHQQRRTLAGCEGKVLFINFWAVLV